MAIELTNGDDVFELGLTQDETIDALAGDDRVVINGTPNPTYSGEDEDPAPYTVTVYGSEGNDRLMVNGLVYQAVLHGGEGDDVFSDNGDYDWVDYTLHPGNEAYGGSGNDTFHGEFLDASGGDGHDTLYGGGSGDDGDDNIY